MNYTSIEQSKKLLELGLNPNTADMWYEDGGLFIVRLGRMPKEHADTELPCWSLGALLELMPHSLKEGSKEVFLDIFSTGADYCIEYNNPQRYSLILMQSESIFDVVFDYVVWLFENGYIKTEKK